MCVCVCGDAFRKAGFKLCELQFVTGHSIFFLPCNILSPSVKESLSAQGEREVQGALE